MKRKEIYACLIFLLTGIFLAGEALAQSPPHTIFGTVKKDGANVPAGTIVTAWIGSVQCASAVVTIYGADSVYSLNVPVDDPTTPAKDGGVNGDNISFMVGSEWAPQTVSFSSGLPSEVNLALTTLYTLTVSASPYNGGSVAKTPNKSSYGSGEQVTLTASANSGYQFSSWGGDAAGTNPTVGITMNSNKTVTAVFTQVQVVQYTLAVSSVPANGGYVTVNPSKASYSAGEQVALTAMAGSGYQFGYWSGDASGVNSTVTVTMNSSKAVTANFTQSQAAEYTLSVSSNPANGGYVTVNPSKASYSAGEQVALTATAGSGYQFGYWSGDASGANSTVTVTMNSSKAVTANFNSGTAETVAPPAVPSGPGNGMNQTLYTYSTGGSSSSLKHSVQYRFDWGDGALSQWLPVGSLSASHAWNSPGTYFVKAQARCAEDGVESTWSSALTVVIGTVQQLPLIGLLESPVEGSRVSGITTIHGWALDGKGIKKVELYIDGIYVGNIPYGGGRKDVQGAFPDYPGAEFSGFGLIWNYSVLPPGPHEILVKVHNLDGATKDLISNMVVGQFHGEFVENVSPGERWIYNMSVTVNGLTKHYDVKLQWSTSNQNFVITDIVLK